MSAFPHARAPHATGDVAQGSLSSPSADGRLFQRRGWWQRRKQGNLNSLCPLPKHRGWRRHPALRGH